MNQDTFVDFVKCLHDGRYCLLKLRKIAAGKTFRQIRTRALMLEPAFLGTRWAYPISPVAAVFVGLLFCALRDFGVECSLTICEPEVDSSSDSGSGVADEWASVVIGCKRMLIRVNYDKWRIIAIDRPLDFSWSDVSCRLGLSCLCVLFAEGYS